MWASSVELMVKASHPSPADVGSLHPRVPAECLAKMVSFLKALHEGANVQRRFAGAGGPWEFNLRDLLRWCDLAEGAVPADLPEYAQAMPGYAQAKPCRVHWQPHHCWSRLHVQ